MANKTPIRGNAFGFTPAPVPRPAGMTDREYRDYVRRMQGDQARSQAAARGLNTGGMFWDGSQFRDADERHWYSDPAVLGPLAVGAGTGLGLLTAPAAAGASGAGLAADGTIPFTTAPGVQAAALSGTVGPSAALGSMAPAAPASAGGGLSGLLKSLTSASNLPSLIGLGASLAMNRGGGGTNTAEIDRIKQITEAQMRRADPLHQAITSLAMSRLPTAFQRPVPDVPLPGSK